MKLNFKNSLLITIVFIVLTLVSFFIISTYFRNKIEDLRTQQFNDQQLVIAEQSASSLIDLFENIRLQMISLSAISQAQSTALSIEEDKLEIFNSYYGDFIIYLFKTDKSGKIIEITNKKYESVLGNDISNTEIFTAPIISNGLSITDDENYLGLDRSIVLSIPYYEENVYSSLDPLSFSGVISAVVDIKNIENFFNGIKIGSKGSIWVIDSQGKYITEPIEEWKEISKKTNYFSWVKENYPKNSDFINEMIAESSGTIIEDWENYGKTITAYTHFMIGSKEWILGISTPYSELKEDIVSLNNKMFYFMLSTLGILSISFIFILLLLRSQEKTESKLKRVEVTLKEFGIESILETTTNGKIDIELNPNNIYLLKEKNDSYAAELFVSTLNKGYAGLGMTRDNPKLIKEKFKLEKTPFIWLKKSKNKSDKSSLVNVKDLQKIMFDFMNHGKSVILIERFDYIITQNEFKSSLNFLQSLRDVVMIKDSIIIISLNPNSLNDKELNLIESECKDISNIIIKEKPKLPKDIFDILIFIFKMNDSGKVIYFKTISKEFNITKPTTSKKILELKNYGFIEIEKHGRVKSVLITDVGREFIK